MTIPLVCPQDRCELTPLDSGLVFYCSDCCREYPVVEGVVRFVGAADQFYEGAYKNRVKYVPRSERWYAAWPLWLINGGFLWRTRREVRAGGTILEIGCASGVRYFARRYRMIGLDLSHSSLTTIAGVYRIALQADATRGIPLPSASVDAVISSYFWEHIDPAVKPLILEECHRVLKPGGKLIFLYDVDTQNPLVAHMRRVDRALYSRLFLEQDGHVGYQSLDENKAIFQSVGFQVLRHFGMERTPVQSTSVYEKLSQWPTGIRVIGSVGRRFGTRPWFRPYTLIVRVIDETIGRLLPREWARIALTVCVRLPNGAPAIPAGVTGDIVG